MQFETHYCCYCCWWCWAHTSNTVQSLPSDLINTTVPQSKNVTIMTGSPNPPQGFYLFKVCQHALLAPCPWVLLKSMATGCSTVLATTAGYLGACSPPPAAANRTQSRKHTSPKMYSQPCRRSASALAGQQRAQRHLTGKNQCCLPCSKTLRASQFFVAVASTMLAALPP